MANGTCSCCSSSCQLSNLQEENREFFWSIGVGGLLFGVALCLEHFFSLEYSLLVYGLAYLVLGYDILFAAFKSFFKGLVLDEMVLMALASMGAFFISAYAEACAVMLFFKVGEHLQEKALSKSRKNISSLLALRPTIARVIREGQGVVVSPQEVKVGDIIEVRPGEKIPLDGEVVEGSSFLDTSPLTGEGVPKLVTPGEKVLSGCINGKQLLKVKVDKPYVSSTIAKVIELIEKSAEKKAKVEKMITRLAKIYTPFVVTLALGIAFIPPWLAKLGWISLGETSFSSWFYRGLVFLVISCPCALVLSIPLGFFAGVGGASKEGILVKGASYLELLAKVKTIVWDKTGTLTQGDFRVQKILSLSSLKEEEILKIAASLEAKVSHPIANSILKEAEARKISLSKKVRGVEVVEGKGVKGILEGKEILVGSLNFLKENQIGLKEVKESIGTQVYIALDGELVGVILIEDRLKDNAKRAIEDLKKIGVKRQVLLTGDIKAIAKKISEILRIKEFFAELLPQDKVFYLEKIIQERKKGEVIVCVGDGINDAPMLRLADVGIAMGEKGVDVAMESADVVLLQDDPLLVKKAIIKSRKTLAIIWQNIFLALGVKGVVLFLGSLGLANMWMAIFADVGVALLAVLNAVRAFR